MLERLRRSFAGRKDEATSGRPVFLALGLASAALLVGVAFCMPDAQAHAASEIEVSIGNHKLDATTRSSAVAMTAARAFLRTPIKLIAGPWEFDTTRGKLGARVDLKALTSWIDAARDPRSALRRLHAQELGDAPLAMPIPAALEDENAEQWVLQIRDQVHQKVRDARIDLRAGQIIPEQAGLTLDVHGTLDALADAIFRGHTTVQARLIETPAQHTAGDLRALDFSQVLGSFETRYNGQDAARTYNLRVAARHLDGVVVMPDEVLDFNAIVGERSEANGFRPATVIAGGELSDGVGGGTCQIAGTLHAAAYFAGLPMLERNTHTRPSGYIKLGLDAVVAYPKLNLRFKNDLPHAIALGIEVANGRVKAEIRGPASVAREVSFVRRVDEFTPYAQIEREDPTLPSGVRVLSQRGVAGFRLTSFRVVRDVATKHAVRERITDSYPPTTQIWRVGTGGEAPEGFVAPPHDPHGEYRADEYLILTQAAGARELTETVRREGKTGYVGWTAHEGMPQAE